MAGYAAMQLGAGSISAQIDDLISTGRAKQVGVSATIPPGIPVVGIDDLQKLFGAPFYKKWWFWAGIGTLTLGGGYIFLRRKRT